MNRFLITTTCCILGITCYRSTVHDGVDVPMPVVFAAALLGGMAFVAAVVVTVLSIRRIVLQKSVGIAIACMLLCTPVFWPLVKFRLNVPERAGGSATPPGSNMCGRHYPGCSSLRSSIRG